MEGEILISPFSFTKQISQSIIQIELFDHQLQELDETIKLLMDAIVSVIKTVPGIGSLNGAAILGAIGELFFIYL